LCADHFKKGDLLVRNLASGTVPIKYQTDLEEESVYLHFSHEECQSQPQGKSTSEDDNLFSFMQQSDNADDTLHILTPKKKSNLSEADTPSTCNNNFINEIITLPSPKKSVCRKRLLVMPETPRKKRLREKLYSVSTELKSVQKELNKKQKATFTCARNLKSLSTMPRAITRMQLHHKPRTQWLSDEKNTAISMYYKSPSMYKFLRKNGVILPSVSIIKNWLKNFKCQPGFNQNFFRKLNLKGQTMTEKEKKCILMFDEMAIKQEIEYSVSKDLIEGFEDLGEFGRKPVAAKQALVVLLRGLYSDWKVPIAYYFSENGIKAEVLEKILKKNLDLLSGINMNPSAIVCDQSTTNQRLFRTLQISEQQTYFHYKGRKYFGLFDVPHLLKSIRNNLVSADFLYNSEKISFDVIRKTYEIDHASKTGRALLKISEKHLNPNAFQKMSVRLAAQVLSHSVAAAIKTSIATNQISLEEATPTATFVEKVDRLFDALNSKYLYSKNPCNRALSDSHVEVLTALEEGYKLFKRVQKIDKKGKLSRPPCFDGILLSINTIRQLFEENKHDNYSFLLTGRLNQDPLENLFSVLRQKGGYNRNPTVRTFQAALKSNMITNLMKPSDKANCEPDEDTNIFDKDEIPDWVLEDTGDYNNVATVSSIKYIDAVTENIPNLSSIANETSTSSSSTDIVTSVKTVSLEECAVVYFAGYLIKKCLQHFKCDQCKTVFEEASYLSEDNRLLLFYKNYSIEKPCALKNPSSEMISFTKTGMNVVANYLKTLWGDRHFGRILQNKIIEKMKACVPNFFDNECKNHKLFLVNFLVKVLVFKECKSYTNSLKGLKVKSYKKSTKLSILQHD
jgi:hypothetical protein